MHHRHHESARDDLRDQLMSLSDDVAAMKQQMARRGRDAYRETRHFSEDAADWISDYAGDMRRGAKQIQRSAREHPTMTASLAIGMLAIGLAAAMLMRR